MPGPVPREPSFWEYAKTAFLYHWNLLAFGAGLALGVISGRPDVVCPLVAAGELAFLTLLISHPRFRAAVAARRYSAAVQGTVSSAEEMQTKILATLSNSERAQFVELKDRCLRLCEITSGIHSAAGEVTSLENLRQQGVDRLLWMYLKLLYTKHMMEEFFSSTDAKALNLEYADLCQRLQKLGPADPANLHQVEVRRSLEDNIATYAARQDNYRKAQENFDYIKLELSRLDNKINGILEAAVNRQDPGFITGQVNTIADSMSKTEQTMSELQFLTGLDNKEEAVPPMLRKVTQ